MRREASDAGRVGSSGEDVYAGNDLDRGHLARRSDLLWGTLDDARAGNEDSFYFTNIAPQMNDFNQSGLDGVWGLLEDAVLEQAGLERRRLTLFGGPVLTDDDVVYRDVLIPGAFWKVVVYVLDGTLSARCFVLAQEVDPLRLSVTLDDFATYELSLADIEALLEKPRQQIVEQRLFAAEKMRAAGDVEKEAVRSVQRHQRRVAVAPVGQRLDQPPVGFRIGLDDLERRIHGAGIGDARSAPEAEQLRLLIQGGDAARVVFLPAEGERLVLPGTGTQVPSQPLPQYAVRPE